MSRDSTKLHKQTHFEAVVAHIRYLALEVGFRKMCDPCWNAAKKVSFEFPTRFCGVVHVIPDPSPVHSACADSTSWSALLPFQGSVEWCSWHRDYNPILKNQTADLHRPRENTTSCASPRGGRRRRGSVSTKTPHQRLERLWLEKNDAHR